MGGVAGLLSPYSVKGEFGRDVEVMFAPVVLAAVIAENGELWIAGITGLLVGFTHIVMITFGQELIGVRARKFNVSRLWDGRYKPYYRQHNLDDFHPDRLRAKNEEEMWLYWLAFIDDIEYGCF